MRRFGTAILVAGALLAPVGAPAASSPPGTCASVKAKATGVQVAHSMACHASATRKGLFVSLTCLTKAQTKMAHAFAKGDKKGVCGMADDASIVGDSVRAWAEGMAAGLFPAGAGDAGRLCASSKIRRTGGYGRRRLACWARAFRKDASVDPSCLQGAATWLRDGFAKIEAKGDCPTTDDWRDIAGAADGFVDAVGGLLMPPPTTTSSTYPLGGTTTTTTIATTTTMPSGGTTTTITPGGTTTTSTIPSIVSFSQHVQPILTNRCATAGCHAGVHPAEDMDLSAGQAYGHLVNVTSAECPLFKRVLPGKPSQSYVLFKLAGPPQPCFSGNQMPGGGAPPLSSSAQNLIGTWISQGAANN